MRNWRKELYCRTESKSYPDFCLCFMMFVVNASRESMQIKRFKEKLIRFELTKRDWTARKKGSDLDKMIRLFSPRLRVKHTHDLNLSDQVATNQPGIFDTMLYLVEPRPFNCVPNSLTTIPKSLKISYASFSKVETGNVLWIVVSIIKENVFFGSLEVDGLLVNGSGYHILSHLFVCGLLFITTFR